MLKCLISQTFSNLQTKICPGGKIIQYSIFYTTEVPWDDVQQYPHIIFL